MPAKLSQPEYLHILLNHLPLVGLAVATLVTGVALLLRNRGAIVIGLALLAGLAATVWPVTETGEEAYNRMRPLLDDEGKQALRRHMDLAEGWAVLYYAAAGAALLGLVTAWKRPQWLWPVAVLSILLALASLVAGAWIAEAGGCIRHPEFRAGAGTTTPSEAANNSP